MPDTVYALLQTGLSRIMSLWIKPDILPADPKSLIDLDKPVLYVLETGGIADRTALRIACKQFGLPAPTRSLVYGHASEGTCVDVLQRRRGLIFRRHRQVLSHRLSRLVHAGTSGEHGELQIVPVAVYWGRAPDKEVSIWRLLFTENWQIAGRTRKLLTTLVHGRQTLLSFSEPLSFTTLKSSGEPAHILQRKLSRILRVHFRQRRIASLGPDQSHRRILIDHVLSDPAVKSAIETEAQGKTSLTRAQQKAEKYAFEIAADISYPTVRILHRLMKRLWNQLYDGIELSGINRLKQVADGKELVYVPCHRSHIDYLLLSYILYVQGFSLPHIAAGVNLNLPMVGGLLRRGGAFFLRRSFAGNPLYATVFNAYLKEILQRGHALEYFVEGGRSRTGRLLPPKGGMLAMTVHAFLRKAKTPVVFVPVYFGYERLLEGKAFTSELASGKKQRESLPALIKSLKTLRKNYGRVYVNFGQPIALNDILDSTQPQWRDLTVTEERPEWVKPVVDKLGSQIMRAINEAASVTPISLLATTLLATPKGCIARAELLQQIQLYQSLLKSAYIDSLVIIPDINPDELIEHGKRLGYIESQVDAIGPVIQLRPGQAAPLTYFRNNILHLLSLPALIAAAFTNNRSCTDTDLRHLLQLTFPFVQGELFLTTELDDNTIDNMLTALTESGLISFSEEHWWCAPIGSTEAVTLMHLAQVVAPALERNFLCAYLLVSAKTGSIQRDELAQRCEISAERLSRTHGQQSTDLFDKHLHRMFIEKLTKTGYIERQGDTLKPTAKLLNLEAEARSLLNEQIRHAIMSLAKATAINPQEFMHFEQASHLVKK